MLQSLLIALGLPVLIGALLFYMSLNNLSARQMFLRLSEHQALIWNIGLGLLIMLTAIYAATR